MSKFTPLSDELHEYLVAHGTRQDDVLRRIQEETAAMGDISVMQIAPDQGQHYRWTKGDLIIVDHFLWHQHFNDDPVNQCRLVRVHMFDSVLETMRTLMDPMVLFEEAEDTLLSTQELSQIQWPADTRPGD